MQRPVNITTFTDYDLGLTELRSPYKSRNRRWLVQMNTQASRHVRDHEVVWSDLSSAEGAPEPEYDEKTGSGRGLDFVETLQAGDRIALIARALVSPVSRSLSPILPMMHTVSGLGKSRPQCGDRSRLPDLIPFSISLFNCLIAGSVCIQYSSALAIYIILIPVGNATRFESNRSTNNQKHGS